MRQFETGATRDAESGKLDYEGFLSYRVIERYAEYMDKHRMQADGNLRDSDNWQKGIPITVYIKSLWRHFFSVWKIHRGGTVTDERDGHIVTMDEALCGVIFNTMGYLDQYLKTKPVTSIPGNEFSFTEDRPIPFLPPVNEYIQKQKDVKNCPCQVSSNDKVPNPVDL